VLAPRHVSSAQPLVDEIAEKIQARDAKEGLDRGIYVYKMGEKYPLKSIAEALVQRRRTRELVADTKKDPKDYIEVDLLDPKKANIILFFSHNDDIQSMAANGIYEINQMYQKAGMHGKVTNSANDLAKYRSQISGLAVDTELSGLYDEDRFKPETKSKEEKIRLLSIHPKSALLNLKVVYPGSENYLNRAEAYGAIGAVLKEQVKSRSVWASDDTLTMLRNPFETARDGLNRNYEKEKFEDKLHQDALDLNLGTFTKRAHLPKKGYGEIFGLEPSHQNWYRETLIYGPLEPTDIDHFLINSVWVSPQVLESLKLFNVPIYEIKKTKDRIFEAGALLYMPPS